MRVMKQQTPLPHSVSEWGRGRCAVTPRVLHLCSLCGNGHDFGTGKESGDGVGIVLHLFQLLQCVVPHGNGGGEGRGGVAVVIGRKVAPEGVLVPADGDSEALKVVFLLIEKSNVVVGGGPLNPLGRELHTRSNRYGRFADFGRKAAEKNLPQFTMCKLAKRPKASQVQIKFQCSAHHVAEGESAIVRHNCRPGFQVRSTAKGNHDGGVISACYFHRPFMVNGEEMIFNNERSLGGMTCLISAETSISPVYEQFL